MVSPDWWGSIFMYQGHCFKGKRVCLVFPGIYTDFVILSISIQPSLEVICFLSGKAEPNEVPSLPSKSS